MATTQTIDDPTGNGWEQPPFDSRISTLAMLQNNPGSQNATNSAHPNVANKGGIERGFIKQAPQNAAAASTQTTSASGFLVAPRTVYFLYNPSSVNVSHAINLSDPTLDPSLRSVADPGQVGGPTGATVDFSLYFDRTYETSNPENFGTRLGEKGVAVDIEALYAMTGILQLQNPSAATLPSPFLPQVSGSDNTGKAENIAKQWVTELNQGNLPSDPVFTIQDILNGTTKSPSGSPETEADKAAKQQLEKRLKAAGLSLSDLPPNPDFVNVVNTDPNTPSSSIFVGSSALGLQQQRFGFMTMNPVVVVFGRQRATWSPTVEYYGYISSMSIEYAHWTQNMVPSRCAVSITLTLLSMTVDQMTQISAWNGP